MKYHANLSLDLDLYKKVQQIAREKETNVSAIVESLFATYIEAYEQDNAIEEK